jgi:hypothetical protein
MSVIPLNMIMIDRHGHEWRQAPNYQDQFVNGRGWLLLRSSYGDDLPFADVVAFGGFEGPDGQPYLHVRLVAAEPSLCTCEPPYGSSVAPNPFCPVHRHRAARLAAQALDDSDGFCDGLDCHHRRAAQNDTEVS